MSSTNEGNVGVHQRRNGEWVKVGEMTRAEFDAIRPVIAQYDAEQKTLREMVADGVFESVGVAVNEPTATDL